MEKSQNNVPNKITNYAMEESMNCTDKECKNYDTEMEFNCSHGVIVQSCYKASELKQHVAELEQRISEQDIAIRILTESNTSNCLKWVESDNRREILEQQKAEAIKMLKDLSQSTTASFMEIDEVIKILQKEN